MSKIPHQIIRTMKVCASNRSAPPTDGPTSDNQNWLVLSMITEMIVQGPLPGFVTFVCQKDLQLDPALPKDGKLPRVKSGALLIRFGVWDWTSPVLMATPKSGLLNIPFCPPFARLKPGGRPKTDSPLSLPGRCLLSSLQKAIRYAYYCL